MRTFEYEGWPGQVSLEQVTFTERDGRTTVHAVSAYLSVQARNAMIESGMGKGVTEGYEQLDELITALSVPGRG